MRAAAADPRGAGADRARIARVEIGSRFTGKQQRVLDFVLAHYVREGVHELGREKPTPLLRLRYGLRYHDSIADAVADLGRPDEIGRVFAGFPKYLYQERAAA